MRNIYVIIILFYMDT